MVATINQSYISQFSSNLYHLLDANGSKLKGLFSEEMAKGENHFFDRLGNFAATEVTSRLEPVTLQDPAHSRRMATVKRFQASTYLDDIDKLKMLIDPTNDYAMKLANAHGKNFDQALLSALVGTAATGKDGTGTQAFDTTNQQIAHGGTGLTKVKLDQALRILQTNRVDIFRDDVYLILNGRGLEDLMAESTLTSLDFQNKKVLAGKEIPNFRGLNFIFSEDLPEQTAGSVYRAIMCTADSLKVAIAQDIEIKTSERADLNFAQQISTYMFFGAVRMEEGKVVDILFQ